MMYQLAPYFSAGIQNSKLFMGFGSIQKEIADPELQKKYLTVGELFCQPTDIEQVTATHPQLKNEIQAFADNHWLIPQGLYNREHRHSRHTLFYNMCGADAQKVQEKIENSHIAVLGCGGIGNIVSVNLATSGVGKISLYDDDQIELSNLTRQILFTENDEGASKTDTLKRELKKRSSQTQVHTINKRINCIEDLNDLKDVDLFVLSADARGVVGTVNKFCVDNQIALVNVGYINDIAVWGPFYVPSETGCMACQSNIANAEDKNPEVTEKLKKINSGYQAPSIGPVNMLAASHASLDILKYIGGFGEISTLNRRAGVWTHDFHLEFQDYSKNPACKVCGNAS